MPALIYEKDGEVAILTMNRPEVLNAQNSELTRALHEALVDFRDDPQLRVAILTGAGDRAFSAGADLKEMANRPAGAPRPSGPSSVFPLDLYKPVIAAMNGLALGAGLERALDCDIRILAENAVVGLPEVKRGITPGTGVHALPRAIPLGQALYILLTGEHIPAADALRMGLVQMVVPAAEVMPTARRIAAIICENAPLAVQAVKQIALMGATVPIDQARLLSEAPLRRVRESEDSREGPRAFAEKRKPEYRGL